MKKLLAGFLSLLWMGTVFFSCQQAKTFKVTGNIGSAEGDTLYLEHRGLAGVRVLDSTVLKNDGAFAFKQSAPENPEFYQLRIGKRIAAFAVDSTETLRISANTSDWYDSFTVEDSPTNDQMKEVDLLTRSAARKIDELEKNHQSGLIDEMAFIEQLDSALRDYKREVSRLILGNPAGATAYYAVFQKIKNYLIFDPYDRQDYAMFGAVATSWNRYYPDTERTKHLYEFTMNALKTRRQKEQQAKLLEKIPVEEGAGLPDIVLSGVDGRKMALSSLAGKVVLLDFVVYGADFSPKHNMDLNTLYARYQSRGFEIYQISFDSDEHFWKTSAANLPWLTVRDPRSVNSTLLATYNVRQIPTAFLVNRAGDIVARIENYAQLSGELDKVL
ncbi:TlpA disulfide reductase family protein [Proteiniphilum sp. X52]|uniref:TlpA disulfide reductase family protein n=1 Tax=Proteiniphilum sp. X52 TaxID=2382159 RepID=UPI000F0A33C0|nr:TlpA disulfide reductase family protein [Proteiniphilum sp. X52]RNC65903.1 AhpC/TSA family protein [Proteiniphilum sp. X52]